MATNEAIPYWDTGDTLTAHCSAAVIGKRFLHITGTTTDGNPTVALADGTKPVFGVAAYDRAAGGKVTVHRQLAIVVPVRAGAAITAGALVKSDATGQAIPHGGVGTVEGMALADAAIGADCMIDRNVRG